MLAAESCVTAIYFGLHYLDAPFKDLLSSVISIGGDVDTIAAMACAIWGAGNGSEDLKDYTHNIEGADMVSVLANDIAKFVSGEWLYINNESGRYCFNDCLTRVNV
ncbi:MAG: hypothetical protein Tsb002_38520 [Wenzhouxiangellaceae bacterium]